MNKLPIEKRKQIINLLVEGNSLRATTRICDVSINTVTKLLVDIGKACEKFHDEKVCNVKATRVQADEMWSFVYSKEKNVPDGMEGEAVDVWTWTALDADTKLMISWYVGNRDAMSAREFMMDISTRLTNRVQLTTDGFRPYIKAVDAAFDDEIDFAQVVKIYGTPDSVGNDKRYSPAQCTGAEKHVIEGRPDEKHISTSYVESQNLTMRMHMRRFTRLTNAFSKKVENHAYAIALHFVCYNFCKVHKSLRVTPAMEAKLATKPMTIEDICSLAPIEAPKKRGPYKKKYTS
ncbi:MAG: DDE-type integrase/transposase/recombinase [Chitinophagaceae bacterium]|nr:DDE-type integrase/transposase/recombinase [Chitinophagaceae bacterium]